MPHEEFLARAVEEMRRHIAAAGDQHRMLTRDGSTIVLDKVGSRAIRVEGRESETLTKQIFREMRWKWVEYAASERIAAARKRRSPAMPEFIADYLAYLVRDCGHDESVVGRLLTDNENLNGVWRWLLTLDTNKNQAECFAQLFVGSSLKALGWVRGWKEMSQQQRRKWLASFSWRKLSPQQRRAERLARDANDYGLLIDRAWQSRENTPRTIFLRTLRSELEAFGFPMRARGLQERVAVITSELLGEDVQTRQVSKLFRE